MNKAKPTTNAAVRSNAALRAVGGDQMLSVMTTGDAVDMNGPFGRLTGRSSIAKRPAGNQSALPASSVLETDAQRVRTRLMASSERSTSSTVVRQFETEMRTTDMPCHVLPVG